MIVILKKNTNKLATTEKGIKAVGNFEYITCNNYLEKQKALSGSLLFSSNNLFSMKISKTLTHIKQKQNESG